MELSPQRKNAKGKVVHAGQRRMIINIYKEKKSQFPEHKYKEIIELVMAACGIGRRTVMETISQYRKTGDVSSPPKTRAKPGIMQKLKEQDIDAIKKHIHAFLEKKEPPTVAKILAAINKDMNFPTMSLSTLRRVLKQI